jgi:hypothetical protein
MSESSSKKKGQLLSVQRRQLCPEQPWPTASYRLKVENEDDFVCVWGTRYTQVCLGAYLCATRTRTNTNPNDKEANAAGRREVRLCSANGTCENQGLRSDMG